MTSAYPSSIGVAKNTIVKMLADYGQAASELQGSLFVDLDCKRIEADEIWSFCYAKQKNIPDEHVGEFGYGDVWTWTAIDADTKLVPSWLVGERTTRDCYTFLSDLHARLALGQRIQLTTDGFGAYRPVVDAIWRDNIDYAQIIKDYTEETSTHRYSPATCSVKEINVLAGNPDRALISTSYVERQNLTMRMGMRRFTRLTNGFSKKIENLAHAVSLHFAYYNLCRPHQTIKTTPAVAAGVERHPLSLYQLVERLESN